MILILEIDPLAMTQQYLKLKRLQQRKKKRTVDTGASKGRKLRYHTHEKLVGFMVSQVSLRPQQLKCHHQLF